jgi:hypothetical protein
LVFLLGVLSAGSAQAILAVTSVESPVDPLRVGTDTGTVTVHLEVDCETLMARVQPLSPQAPVPLTVSPWTGDASVLVVGADHVDLPTGECGQGKATAHAAATFSISVNESALAGQPQSSHATLRLADSPAGKAEATATATVRAAPYRITQVDVPERLRECACQRLEYTVRVQNRGNTPASYRLEVARAPSHGNLTLPALHTLQPPQAAGEHSQEAAVVYEAPPGDWGEQPFELRLVTLTAEGTPVPGAQTLGFLAVHADPDAKHSPGAGLAVLPMLLAAALLRCRRA